MIRVYYANTPNVFKVTIALAELGLECERVYIDMTKGDQFNPEFQAINPNNRIPAITDMNPADGGKPVHVFESGAILLYLAEKTGKLLPKDPRARAEVMEWVFWQTAGQGPMLGQLGHFLNYAPEQIPYAIRRYDDEGHRLYRILDERLAGRDYIAGEYSIADIICWPWLLLTERHNLTLDPYPNLQRWYRSIDMRPAVRAALGDWTLPPRVKITEEIRKIMFNQR
jgi:GST-like protein